jgi:hypothetical protein
MQIDCPNCKAPISLPPKLMQIGVARLDCARCAFTFVARLGSPSSSDREDRNPDLPIYLEGVKSSSAAQETAGEIGPRRPAFIPADTRTTVVIDGELKREIERHRTSEQGITGSHARQWVSAATDRTQLPRPAAGLEDMQTLTSADESEGERTAESPISADSSPLPPVETEPDNAGQPSTAARNTRSESAEFECYAPVDSPLRSASLAPLPQANATPRTRAAVGTISTSPMAPTSAPAANLDVYSATAPTFATGDQTLPHEFDAAFPAHRATPGRALRVLGMLISISIFACIVLALFVMARNDWSFDLSNLDRMLAHAFSGEAIEELPPEIAQLEVSSPIAELTQLKDNVPVVTAEGVVKNVGTRTRRFIYLRASVKRNRHVIAIEEAPAGNLFSRAELAQLTKRRLQASLNPAGRQGRNARVAPGESVAYMVVITGLPNGFDLSQHRVVAEVSQAELTDTDE